MEKILNRSRSLVAQVDTSFIRNPGNKISWDWRLTGILGARGTGKTTLFLQQYVDDQYTFEVGGQGKNTRQIVAVSDSFIVADELEIGYKNKIPLWLFGLLY